jgi:hypothetical protein
MYAIFYFVRPVWPLNHLEEIEIVHYLFYICHWIYFSLKLRFPQPISCLSFWVWLMVMWIMKKTKPCNSYVACWYTSNEFSLYFGVGNPNTIVALAGNKADMLDARQVPAEVCNSYFSVFPLPIHFTFFLIMVFKPSSVSVYSVALS